MAVNHQMKTESGINVLETVVWEMLLAVLFWGLVNHWPLPMMLQRGQDFASAIVGIRGAISLDAEFYQEFIETWELC